MKNQEKIYSIENGQIVEHDIDKVRHEVNLLNGVPTSTGISPRYEIKKEIEYRVIQAGENGYGDHVYGKYIHGWKAQDSLRDVITDDPDRKAWVEAATVYAVGQNRPGCFVSIDAFETEEQANDNLNERIDDMIMSDQENMWFFDRSEAERILANDLDCCLKT